MCQPNYGSFDEYIFRFGTFHHDYTIFLCDIVVLLQVTEESIQTEELFVSFRSCTEDADQT